MPKPMRADARRNYDRLLEVAAVAFAERGADASLDDIAKRAGVGSGTLYRHFPSRRDLLEAVYLESIDELTDRALEFIASERPAGDLLAEWLQLLAEQMIRLSGLKTLLGEAMTDGTSPVISVCSGRLKDAASDLLAAAQKAGAVRADLEPTELLRLTHAVATATELGAGTPQQIGRYLTLIQEGVNAPGVIRSVTLTG
ncbi:helix-turn-helix domain-containing protein [Streptomyces sp. NPDC050738]|uniref:TetR/AcrR family transcriptional regulator n=1 Tax=Streptomyces sp. NPDC050738 TaxID=3154744 RepID=UPI00343E4CCA